MVVVLNTALQKREEIIQLFQLDDELRLRLAAQAAACAAFDWDVAGGTIRWDGATEILPLHLDAANAASFFEGIIPERRREMQALLSSRDQGANSFLIDLAIATALSAISLTMIGTRFAAIDGSTARLTGMVRDTTERTREVRRLSYLATRDELTGNLNRNALREELSDTIESAKAENRNCAFLVASVDRLAMINDSFGFDAGDEVIMGTGDRLARTLRGSDIIGRTAGNKFGVILKNCRENEIAVVAARLRASVGGGQRHRNPGRHGPGDLQRGRGVAARRRFQQPGSHARRRTGAGQGVRQRPRRLCRLRTLGPARDRAPAADADLRRGNAGTEG